MWMIVDVVTTTEEAFVKENDANCSEEENV